jgi:uncharacterized MAPEG superfamily protein
MSNELYWLAWTLPVTALACFPYVLNRFARRGIVGVVANPSPDDMPLAGWAQRAQRAHANAIENLAVFAPAVLAVIALHREDSLTAIACAVYFVSRTMHFLVYTAGIPVIRTLAFFGGWFATLVLILRLMGVL